MDARLDVAHRGRHLEVPLVVVVRQVVARREQERQTFVPGSIVLAVDPRGSAGLRLVDDALPRVEEALPAGADEVRLSFSPVLVPMSRGILATVTAPVAPGVTAEQLRDAWQTAYADEPFVEVLPAGVWPTTASVLGANTALVQVALDEAAGPRKAKG